MTTLTLPTYTSIKDVVYVFDAANTTAELTVTKKEYRGKVYSVLINFLGIVNERRAWQRLC